MQITTNEQKQFKLENTRQKVYMLGPSQKQKNYLPGIQIGSTDGRYRKVKVFHLQDFQQ